MKTQRQILHVYAQSRPESHEIEATLAELDVVCVRAADCYAAMASLVRQGPTAYEAILVLLSDLARSDQEFIQLASHRYRSSPIYVYGPPGAEITANWATQAGARSSITPAQLRLLFVAHPSRMEPPSAAVELTEQDRVSRLVVQEIVRPLQQVAAVTPASASALQAIDQCQPQGILARREESAQLRRRPAGTTPEKQVESFASDIGPLLSPEELRALLGDDTEEEEEVEPG